jgi:hypothetical protein
MNTMLTNKQQTELEAASFRRLLKHLIQERPDVQNIDLMILAGFCRNCLSQWYQEAASEQGLNLTKEQAQRIIYGMAFSEWKLKHQTAASAEQLAAFASQQAKYS